MKASVLTTVLLIVLAASLVSAQTSITLQSITNVTFDSVLAGGSTHTVTIRFNASGAPAGRGYLTANGFKIYSPDGADWGSVQGTALGSFSGLGWEHLFVKPLQQDGWKRRLWLAFIRREWQYDRRDTVVVLLAGVNSAPGGGMPAGFNSSALTIEFTSKREDAGLHICIDTCQRAPGAAWEWANADGLIQPAWSGKRCFVIDCCSGRVGDVNGAGGDEPTLGDITTLIGFLFLGDPAPDCLAEADVNRSGTFESPPLDWDDVTIGDVTLLIDYLFLEHTPLGDCP